MENNAHGLEKSDWVIKILRLAVVLNINYSINNPNRKAAFC